MSIDQSRKDNFVTPINYLLILGLVEQVRSFDLRDVSSIDPKTRIGFYSQSRSLHAYYGSIDNSKFHNRNSGDPLFQSYSKLSDICLFIVLEQFGQKFHEGSSLCPQCEQ